MRHINVFLLLFLYQPLYEMSDGVILKYLNEHYSSQSEPISYINIKNFKEANKPTKKQLVHALHHKGFTSKFIQQYLGISQPAVSYNLNSKAPDEYINIMWKLQVDDNTVENSQYAPMKKLQQEANILPVLRL